VPKWQARDDVYQVGQLLGMLIKGDASVRLSTREIRGLPCSDHLKEIVYRCLGERRKRYESADELIDALRNPPAPLKVGTLRRSRACTSRSPASSRSCARRRRGREARGCDRARRARPSARPSSCAAARTRCRRAGATGAAS
jgi:hypothetical protein